MVNKEEKIENYKIFKSKEKQLARALLNECYEFEKTYFNNLHEKYLNLTEEELQDKTLRASDKKFRKKFNKLIGTKLYLLKELMLNQEVK